MNLVWLEDFLALATSGNFSSAAKQRNSSQPAFSRRIRSLELWVGADLFDRSTQPASLTEVGEWFSGIAEELLSTVARVPGEARRLAEASSDTLRIASTHALSFTFLPQCLRKAESKTTLGPVNVMSDVLQRCEALMVQGKVQFVLSHNHPAVQGVLDTTDYRSAQIGDELLLPMSLPDQRGNPRHRLVGAKSTNVPVVNYTDESGLGRIMRAVFGRRLEQSGAQTVFTAHLASVLRAMALDGRGIAWLPQSLVEDDIRQGRLVMAADDDWYILLGIRLYRQRDPGARAAEAFWDSSIGA